MDVFIKRLQFYNFDDFIKVNIEFFAEVFVRFENRFMKYNFAFLFFVVFVFSNFSLQAQNNSSAISQLSAEDRAAALKFIKDKFQEFYVVPEMRSVIIEKLNKAQKTGRYDVSDPRVFAERITEDLQNAANDKHLWLSFDLPAYTANIAPPKSVDGEESFRRARAIRSNHGITEMRILPGNIRYLKIVRFEWISDETGKIYDEAMRFLKDGDAWIVDLRGNGGGTSSAANYFSSHFHDAGTVNYISHSGSETPEKNRSLDYLPVGRLKNKPFYILIDGKVGSAAEAVAYDLQQFKLAELVGTKTAGAANNNKLIPIAPAFILSVSYGRPTHFLTNTNWEGIGVKPNLECEPNLALAAAQSLALKKLAELPNLPPENLTEYKWALTAAEARLNPLKLTAAQLNHLTGTFQNADFGEMKIVFSGETLWLERQNGTRERLSALTSNVLFAIEGNELLRVRLNGKTLELLWWNDPNPRVFSKK